MLTVLPRRGVDLIEIVEGKGSTGSNGDRSVGKDMMRMDSALQPGSNLASCSPRQLVVVPEWQGEWCER